MRIATFPKGMPIRHALVWMIRRHDKQAKTFIRRGRLRPLACDLVYPDYDDLDWVAAAVDLAYNYGLVLYQDHLGFWRITPLTWSGVKDGGPNWEKISRAAYAKHSRRGFVRARHADANTD